MIATVAGFITKIQKQYKRWEAPRYVWFRGEPECDTPLLPSLFRRKPDGTYHDENKLLQMFRMRAPSFASGGVPDRSAIDQWLFLAQHVGIPARLLDWTENALLALYFSLKEAKPVVWMLDPMGLNAHAIAGHPSVKSVPIDEFPLTWFRPTGNLINIGHENIRGAWEHNRRGVDVPVAVHPTYIHPRMSAQRSVFTVHGKLHQSLNALAPPRLLAKLIITHTAKAHLLEELKILGIQEATAYPDLDGLAKELKERY
jgi:hypothetical protein